MHTLRLLPEHSVQPTQPVAPLPPSVHVALPGEARCADRLGQLPCVRRPHADHPYAHVRIAGYYDDRSSAPLTCPIDAQPLRLVS